jgi:hypothetical protein
VPCSGFHHCLSLHLLLFPLRCHTSLPIRSVAKCSGLKLPGPRVVVAWSQHVGSRGCGAAHRSGRDGLELDGMSAPGRVAAAWSNPPAGSWRHGATHWPSHDGQAGVHTGSRGSPWKRDNFFPMQFLSFFGASILA